MAESRGPLGATAFGPEAGEGAPPTSVTRVADGAEIRYVPVTKGASNMAKLLRWTGYVLGAFLVLLLIAAVAVWLISARQLGHVVRKPERLAQPTAAQVADAPRQLRILRCLDCHGEGLRGTLFFNAP